MSAHTPGPWTEGQEGNPCVYGPDGRGDDSGLIAHVFKGRGNVRLIAAAPEMLAELKKIHARSVCSCRLEPLVDGPVPCATCQTGAVIAKAEGRQS